MTLKRAETKFHDFVRPEWIMNLVKMSWLCEPPRISVVYRSPSCWGQWCNNEMCCSCTPHWFFPIYFIIKLGRKYVDNITDWTAVLFKLIYLPLFHHSSLLHTIKGAYCSHFRLCSSLCVPHMLSRRSRVNIKTLQ